MSNLLQMCEQQPVREFAAGETVIRENQKDGRLYVLKSGEAQISKRGTPVTEISTPGSVFGEVALLLDVAHSATVVAEKPCSFHIIEDPGTLLAEHPELYQHLCRLLARRLQLVTDELVDLRERLEAGNNDPTEIQSVIRNLAAHPWTHQY